ncbi:MAG: exo-alpha-sialidase, partial [Clostridia bacterium]|nr:exo-alpha-sialidase [Clostridia bacterium]
MLKRILLGLLLGVTLLSAVACGSGDMAEGTTAVSSQSVPATVEYDFADCKIVYGGSASSDAVKYAQRVQARLRSSTLQEIPLETDAAETAAKEILIGDTNRPESAQVKAKLPTDAGHAYRIELVGNKFVLVATDDDALETAVQCFIYDVVKEIRNVKLTLASDYCYADSYQITTELLSSGVQIKQELITTIYGATAENPNVDLSYARIIELAHNGAYNGVLLATGESLDVGTYLIHRSTDFGATWETVGKVSAQMKDMIANWQPMLFELPCKVGDLEEGTILLAGCIRNSNTTKTNMVIYKSTDFGSTWSLVSIVDSADGFSTTGGLSKGLWEPFLLCDDDGKLWCFYSDEKEAEEHSQKLVCRYSADGVNWSETQEVVALEDPNMRPGMITVTRLGDGQYLATYEIVGMPDVPIYFKITDDLNHWDPADIGSPVATKRGETLGSAPYVCWTPAGGDCGTLLVTANHTAGKTDEESAILLASYDYGDRWVVIDNPLSLRTNTEGR